MPAYGYEVATGIPEGGRDGEGSGMALAVLLLAQIRKAGGGRGSGALNFVGSQGGVLQAW